MPERKPNPTDAKTYYKLGNDYFGKGDYEKSIENYNMAILLNPVFSEAYFNRALSYYQLKNFDKSVADYTKSAELDPQNPIIYNNRGDAFYRKQDFQSAIKDYDKAVSLNPSYYKAYYNRGLSYASIEEYEKAVEDFTKVIEEKPEFAEAYHLRGLAFEYAGDLGSAITDYEKALEINPGLSEAKTHLEGARAKKDQEGKSGGGGEGKGADIKMLQKPNMTFKDVAGMKKLKEEIRNAIVYPMLNPELIQHYGKKGGGGILMYGPPGCGKCLSGDTPVLLANGEVREIKDIYNEIKEKRPIVESEYESIIEQPGIQVVSLNKKTLKIEPKEVTHVYRQKYEGKLYEIVTHSGRRVTVTPEHPFIAIQEGAKKVKAADLSINDYIAIPRQLNTVPSKNSSELPADFRKVDRNMIQYISPKHPHTKAIRPVYEVDGDTAHFFGCMLSEGASIYGTMFFSNSDSRLINSVSDASNNLFGIEPRIKPDTSPGVQKVEIGSVTLMRFLDQVHGFKLRGSRNAKVPTSIMTAHQDIAAKFISAVFECEATIRKDVPEIEFSTASKDFVLGISYLLLRFGIVARVKPKKIKGNDHTYWRLYISGATDLNTFQDEIGFIGENKLNTLKKWTTKSTVENTNIDIVPNISILLNEAREAVKLNKSEFYGSKNGYRYELGKNMSRSYLSKILNNFPSDNKDLTKLRTLSDSDILWDKVVEIKEKDTDGYVYDLTVGENHTFVAGFGGLVVHNTYIVKAAAGECNAGFINAKLSDLLDMYVGNTEKNIHKVFELGRKNSPCILFFDEVDAIGGRRDQGEGAQYMKMAVNQMLYEMDGVEAHNENLLVIAATNAPWDVDPALRRSGRFGKTLYVSEPDYSSRVAILKIHSKKRPIAHLVPYWLLGIACMGFAAADLKVVVEEAATYPWKEAFFAIQKKAEALVKTGVSKEEAEKKAKEMVKPRPISTADFTRSLIKKSSSLPPWYGQAKKQIGKQEEVTIIDGKEHKKVHDSKMGPAEKEAFKQLLSVIDSRNSWWHKMLVHGLIKQISLFVLRVYTLIIDKKLVLGA